ncbi:hypothetical protein MKW98_023365 [Papaver atlanticum]|uniref:Uncharacterized protein n=1 Tax=Papaver atlanticum TaxID=357466 RepID=A0AAD4SYM4_9MAGN|nr:hypothetical protein MKW98_023365 [Papaver atlanticum]
MHDSKEIIAVAPRKGQWNKYKCGLSRGSPLTCVEGINHIGIFLRHADSLLEFFFNSCCPAGTTFEQS